MEDVLQSRAYKMFKNPTKAELIFSNRLRKAKIKFKQQYVIGHYIADFVIGNVVIELDGSSHNGREVYDAKRDSFIRKKGFKVVRINNWQAETFNLDFIRPTKKTPKPRKKTKRMNSLSSKQVPEHGRKDDLFEVAENVFGDIFLINKRDGSCYKKL